MNTNCIALFFFGRLFPIADYSEVHNIDDSDDEPSYVEDRRNVQHQQMPSSSSQSAKNDMKLPAKSRYDSEQMLDEADAKYAAKSASIRFDSQCRNYLKNELQKHSASKLYRYLAVKRSIKWYVCHFVIILKLNHHINVYIDFMEIPTINR